MVIPRKISKTRIMKIAIFGKHCLPQDYPIIQSVFDALARRHAEIGVDATFAQELSGCNPSLQLPPVATIAHDDFSADMVLSIGGDGTFLHTAARIGSKGIPILGINTGRLGFLTDLSGNDIDHEIEEIFNGHYRIEDRSLLQVDTQNASALSWPYALNEAAILKQDSASMISIRMYIDGEFFNTYQADGLVIATPTGSTAYALSAGGPILVPQAANWVIAPVAPHSFTVRPLIVNDDVVISLQVSSRTDKFLLSCDGRSAMLDTSATISLQKAPFVIKVVKGYNHSFSETLRSKLMWGADKRE